MNKQVIKEMVEKVLPDEFVVAGEEAVERIIDNNDSGNPVYAAKGGKDFDIQTTLLTISSVVTIIKTVLEIVEKSKHSQKKEVEVIVNETKRTLGANFNYSELDIQTIVEAVTNAPN